MPLPSLPFPRLISSKQLVGGDFINGIVNLLTGTTTGITATAGGTAVNSIQLSSAFNEITTVTTAGDSVVLPPAKSGLSVCVINSDAADLLTVFASGTDTIKGAASVNLAGGASTCAWFVAVKDGLWRQFNAI